jgi:hypothetical protein
LSKVVLSRQNEKGDQFMPGEIRIPLAPRLRPGGAGLDRRQRGHNRRTRGQEGSAERKRRNQRLRAERLAAEAAAQSISVAELLQKKALEAAKFCAGRVTGRSGEALPKSPWDY